MLLPRQQGEAGKGRGRSESRRQVEARLANLRPCLIGMEACVRAHHLSRKLQMLGHDARLMPAKYVRAKDAQVSQREDGSLSRQEELIIALW